MDQFGRIERAKVNAIRAMRRNPGALRFFAILYAGGKVTMMVTSENQPATEYGISYEPAEQPGAYHLQCACPAKENGLLCKHIGRLLLTGLPYEVSDPPAFIQIQPDGTAQIERRPSAF